MTHDLAKSGYIVGEPGRSGGIRLARTPEDINIGSVIRHTEENLKLPELQPRLIGSAYGLAEVVNEALEAFLEVLDCYTLADFLEQRAGLATLLGSAARPPGEPPSNPV